MINAVIKMITHDEARDAARSCWYVSRSLKYIDQQEELSKLVKEYLELRTILFDWNGLQSHKQEDLDKYRVLEKTIKEKVGIE